MKTQKSLFSTILFFISVFTAFQGSSQTIHPWEIYSVSFESQKDIKNPYSQIPVNNEDDLLVVKFKGISGDAKGTELELTGFWNGENEWNVNFAPPVSGEWEYNSVSVDRSMNNKSGKVDVTKWSEEELKSNPTRRGFIKVRQTGENAGHYFEYADGTPFLWVADTWWNWTKESIYFDTWKKLIDDRAEKGFTLGQLFVGGNGWSPGSSLLDPTFTVLNTQLIQKVERMIEYANSKGITVWVHGWWSRPELNETVGEENMKRWWRYLVHRFAAYNVVWVLAGEYNMHNYGGFDLEFWKDLGQMVKDEDPYKRILSVHNTPPFWKGGADGPQWSTGEVLHDESWLDYNQSQVGHGKYANEMIPLVVAENYKRNPPKPIVVTEPWYEFVEGNPTGMDVRLAAWGGILSGAAGHTYGGGHVWLGGTPESPAGTGGAWPIEEGVALESFDYEGALSMKHLATFFSKINWWEMAPHPELVKDYPQPYCLANPGKEYVLYLRYSGMLNLKIPGNGEKTFSYYWYNPATGESTNPEQITGKEYLQFVSPGMYPGTLNYSDWVLHVY